MKKLLWLSFILFFCLQPAVAQQFNLYNSRTLYDVFENPSQSAYQIDTSRRIAFNFFLPTISINGSGNGSANQALKKLLYNGAFDAKTIPFGPSEFSTITVNTNNYIAMLRVLRTVKHSQEIGLAWQIRDDARVKAPNETIAVFDDYDLLPNPPRDGLLNNKGYNQSYHQFSLSYRADLTKRLSVGAKGSLLSGILYNSLEVLQSSLVDNAIGTMDLTVAGFARSTFKYGDFESRALIPNFKHPGLAFSGGASYRFRNGWFVMANLKDLGFIKWNKKSYEYNFNASGLEVGDDADPDADDRLAKEVENAITNKPINRSFYSIINGKAEILINKDYGNYQPNLILSKSIYYPGGDIVLTNNYHYRNLVFTASADYNTNKYLAIGGQFMVKSANTEFFMGSDHLLKTIETIRDANNAEPPYSSGYAGVSFYMGFGFKFGRVLEHQANANFIPGFNEPSGFLRRIFKGKKQK